ncbi:MAG TPA: hypothetical protein VFJ25_05655 [Casimicrobiaceae bacterium]|jgi:hypothetical protein|nr:hypothetical protein [Casimicrobiaceae bacterium]
MVIVRLLLVIVLVTLGVALLTWLVTRDPRYLRFIALTLKFALAMLLVILLGFAAERLLSPVIGPLL